MRILIQTLGSSGDVDPFVRIGRGLASRGHDVHVFSNEHFRDRIEGAGLTFVQTGDEDDYRRASTHPDLFHPQKGLKVVLGEFVVALLRETITKLRERVVPGDTLLVGSSLGFAARLVRDVSGCPLATVHLAPISFWSKGRMPVFPGPRIPDWMPDFVRSGAYRVISSISDSPVRRHLAASAAELGLAAPRDVFGSWIHSPDGVLGLWPEWFAPRPPDLPDRWRLTGFVISDAPPLDPELDTWLSAGDPPIVFTAGSANHGASDFFREAAEASAALGRRAILATSDPSGVSSALPQGVRHVAYAPFASLLPRAAALVGHGGIGTTAHGMMAGIPQLVVPMAFDQFDNAHFVERLVAGSTLPMRRFRASTAERALRMLLANDAIATGAARARSLCDGDPSVERACDALLAVAHSGQ